MKRRRDTPRQLRAWYLYVVPINAAYGGIWTLLPLYLLDLGGTVIDVGYASASFNLAVIPGSLIWGYVADRYPKRRSLIHAATLAIATIFVAKFLTSSIPTLILLYGIYGFVNTAYTPTTQLLIMELTPKRDWASEFARMSSASSLGFVLGVAPGIIWTQYLPLNTYLIYCVIMQLLALGLAKMIEEPDRILEREALVFSPEAFASRIKDLPLIFLKMPTVNDFKRFYRMVRLSLAQTLPLLFIGMTLFFSGASLFFTSFTPFLKIRMVQDFEVFIVYLLLFTSNTVSFFYAGRISAHVGEAKVAIASMLVRSLTLFSAVALTMISGVTELIMASVVTLAVVGASFTLANTASSIIIYHNLQPGKQGEMLGIYSALTGTGLLLGAFASGFISFHLGYATTFAMAGIVVLLAIVIFRRAISLM